MRDSIVRLSLKACVILARFAARDSERSRVYPAGSALSRRLPIAVM